MWMLHGISTNECKTVFKILGFTICNAVPKTSLPSFFLMSIFEYHVNISRFIAARCLAWWLCVSIYLMIIVALRF